MSCAMQDGGRGDANIKVGEMKVPSPVVDDTAPLLVEKRGRNSFQPNPFWGDQRRPSETSHFSKY